MMSGWWSNLSRRERALVLIAAGLFALLAVSLLVIQPLNDWRHAAAAKAERARDDYELVAAAAALAEQGGAPARESAVPLRQAITASAAAADLELVRIGAESNGQIEVQPETIDGEKLFNWLAVLERDYGVTVNFADISRDSDGLVKAQILVFERR